MSDSSDEGEPFRLRDYSEESDDERPNKRRRTMQQPALRARGLGFVSATSRDAEDNNDDDDEDEEDPDDERPSMGGRFGMSGIQSTFGIGEYDEETMRLKSASPELESGSQTPNTNGTGPSAFGANGKIQKNSFAARMMAKMGHVEGQGLGKSGQGISAPIQAQLLQSRAGLGHGTPPVKSKPAKGEKASKPSSSGTSTPRIKAAPKKKYEVTAIESRGLHVPETIKSIIVDATGSEPKTLSSLSGFSTPTSERGPLSEEAKAGARIKMQLQAYADAWDATKEHEKRLEEEEVQLQGASELHHSEKQKFLDVVTAFERVSTDDSGESREWNMLIQRLQAIQDRFADSIEDLDLPEICSACLEAPLRKELLDWDPLEDPAHLINSFRSIGALLELEKAIQSRHRKRTTPFESLLFVHWFPRIRTALKEWSVYDPEPATSLIQAWQPILSPWLLYKVLHEIVLPKLIEAVRCFPKKAESRTILPTIRSSGSSQNRKAPELHSWMFEWWSLLSSDDLALERFPELKSLVKSKVDSSSWPVWKPLLGSKRAAEPAKKIITTPSLPSTPAAGAIEDVSFKDIVEEWCSENNLILRSTSKSDPFGRLLYRLQDAERRSKGILVYLQEDVVFGEAGEPFGLDDSLVIKVLGR